MKDRIEETGQNRERLSLETLERIKEREIELNAYREHIARQERELDEYRTKLKHEQLVRDKELHKELEAREKFFADRERNLFERQKEVEEQLLRRQEETDHLRMRLEHELVRREAELQHARQELEIEKARYNEESRKKIESKSRDYVADALDSLDKKEKQYHFLSRVWSSIGALSLLGGLFFFGYVTITSFLNLSASMTWEFITFSVFRGLIAVALFIALAKYAFLFSNSYMREALKNGDRRHAINFGKFYLESYGAAAEWSQIKEAFEHWNIAGSNAFSKPEEVHLDVTALEKVASVIEKIGKSLPPQGKDKSV